MQLTYNNFSYLARCLEGFFFGLYSGIFALCFEYPLSKARSNDTKQNIIFYALWVLYVFSVALIALDIATSVIGTFSVKIGISYYHLDIAQITLFGLCDFITQSILIHRCWIVWGCNTRVVIIPSLLAFAFLATWMASIGAQIFQQGEIGEADWGDILALTSLTASMVVNALVTGLIVFRIFKVFREVKGITTSEEKSLGITRGGKLRSIIFIIIESGMVLFAIQLARVSMVSFSEVWTDADVDAYTFIQSVHEMVNGISPTIILVRVSMGLSFHDESSLVEAVGSLQFAADSANAIPGAEYISPDGTVDIEPDDPNSILEMIYTGQERGDNDIGEGDDVQMVDR